MSKSFLEFPTGVAGLGLMTLRLSLSVVLGLHLSRVPIGAVKVILVALIVSLVAGALTRVSALVVAALGFASWFYLRDGASLTALHGPSAAALAMIGPGGYSLDARWFGRRVIDLDR